MSYDTSQYIGLGIKVRDIAATMNVTESLQFGGDGLYVQINDALIDEYKKVLSSSLKDQSEIDFPAPEKLRKIELNQYDNSGRSANHVTSCIAVSMLSLCGIKPEFLKGGITSFELSLMPYGELFVPTEGASATCPSDFVYLKSEHELFNECLIPGLKEQDLIAVYEQEYDDDYEKKPMFDINMAKSLTNLLDAQTATNDENNIFGGQYGPERLMSLLLDKYLGSKEIYTYISVVSTRWGAVHQHGGMEDDEPYVLFGEWAELEDGEWGDPRKDEESAGELEQIQKALVGEDHEGFSVLQPIFGG